MRNTLRRSMRVLASVLVACALATEAYAANGGYNELLLDDTPGQEKIAIYHDATGLLTIGLNLGGTSPILQPEWKYVPVRRYLSHFDGRFLTAADLKDEQNADIILPGFAANKLLVIWNEDFGDNELVPEQFAVGAGPLAAAGAELNGIGPSELLIASTGSAQVGVRGWDFKNKQPVTPTTPYPAGFAQEGLLGMATAGATRGALNPTLGLLRRDAGSGSLPTFESFARNPVPAYGPLNSTRLVQLTQPFTELRSGHPHGASQPGWFLAWGPGLSSLAMIPSGTGNSEVINLGAAIQRIHFLPEVDDEVLVLFEHGGVSRYDFTPGQGLTLRQQLTPPAGTQFASVIGANGRLITIAADANGNLAQFQVWAEGQNGFGIVAQGNWPAPPVSDDNVTVVLYTGDPFTTTAPFPMETFAAGAWANEVQINGGQVAALVESYGGTTQGLGNAALQNLQPAVAPGVGAVALGNQWEPSSSLFHLGSPLVNGLAPITINPPAGSYPNAIAIFFEPGANVTAHYRVNLGAWQTGTGPVWLAQDGTVEYFGEHTSGALSAIHSAAYAIDQPPDADGDGDGVPDAIEILAGGDPAKSDTDGDGASDFAELIAGTDLADPASKPAEPVATFDEIQIAFVWDDELSAVYPADDEELVVTDLTPGSSGESTARKKPGRTTFSNITLERGVMAQKAWLPSNFRVKIGDLPAEPVGPALTALAGIEFPPRPEIPLNLAAADPVAAWRTAAQTALDEFHREPLEFTVGPASTLAGLIVEYWYGQRLVELGRLPNVSARPRLADTPRSPYVGVLDADDVVAIQQPASINVAGHELAHVMQQLNTALQRDAAFAPLRATAEAAFAQAVQANQTGMPLDPPIHALRSLISGDPVPAGFVFPIVQAGAIQLRDQLLGLIDPRPQVVVSGELSFSDHSVALQTTGGRYLLFKADGTPLRATASAWIMPGSTASVRGFLLAGPPPSGILGEIEVLAFEITAVPEAGYADLDGNGLPDAWEQIFLGGTGSPLGGDTDGDGFLDPEELGAGTDPLNATLVPPGFPATPREMRIEFTPGVGPSLVWDGSTTVQYDVWLTAGFFEETEWEPLGAPVASNGPQRHVAPIDAGQPQGFYRVRMRFPWLAQP